MNLNTLPYGCKELINRFAFRKDEENFALIAFNKVCDYTPYEGFSKPLLFTLRENIEERKKLLRRIKKNAHEMT